MPTEPQVQVKTLDLGRLPEPRGQRTTAFRGDRVARTAAAADRVVGCAREAVGYELLGLLVELALGARPEATHAPVDLLHELMGRPWFHRQQTEDRVGRRGHRRRA